MAAELNLLTTMRRWLVAVGTAAVLAACPYPAFVSAQSPIATFKAGVEVVRLTAVVRDRKGRFIEDLQSRDFEVIDNGIVKQIIDFHRELTGVSVALLFDVSGSMEGNIGWARDAAKGVLGLLDDRDEAAVYSFDTHLDEQTPFTAGLRHLPNNMSTIKPFGATSLHDAIAQTARKVADRGEGRRRAVVVFTDGNDNASKLTPVQVSAVASEIDVPVYIFGVVAEIDNPESDKVLNATTRDLLTGPLAELAGWTGGQLFFASPQAERQSTARQMVAELRHQYLIAFEARGFPGWHSLRVRAKDRDLVVRARSGYINGQSRP